MFLICFRPIVAYICQAQLDQSPVPPDIKPAFNNCCRDIAYRILLHLKPFIEEGMELELVFDGRRSDFKAETTRHRNKSANDGINLLLKSGEDCASCECLFLCLLICLSAYLPICLSVSVCVSVHHVPKRHPHPLPWCAVDKLCWRIRLTPEMHHGVFHVRPCPCALLRLCHPHTYRRFKSSYPRCFWRERFAPSSTGLRRTPR